jgi:hypothetical protein
MYLSLFSAITKKIFSGRKNTGGAFVLLVPPSYAYG